MISQRIRKRRVIKIIKTIFPFKSGCDFPSKPQLRLFRVRFGNNVCVTTSLIVFKTLTRPLQGWVVTIPLLNVVNAVHAAELAESDGHFQVEQEQVADDETNRELGEDRGGLGAKRPSTRPQNIRTKWPG